MSDQYKQIVETGEKMLTQDNRATQYPLFVIQDDVRVWVQPGEDYNERERLEYTKEYYLCDYCQNVYETGNVDMPPECENCDEEAFDHYRIDQEFKISQAGVFFTEDAINTHIAQNRHHYRNPKSYVICAWRNPEMVAVMQQIIATTGKEIPSHYA